ncbi:MAG: sugar fermentation stimulation protein SfsA [Rhodospirillaceae bacterium TMED8]|nr:DNA/RNA nuclease SfsA [Magnetovibrio sp.]OUT53267.1 MAG: sugar fermentation stimulation protein SfsA [Rhodospirillaceae bacterium TMED8]
MKFNSLLIKGRLIKRYKRFLADVELESGETVTAHCANSGSMLSINVPGAEVWLSPAKNPERKLKYTWELIRIGRSLVGANTSHPNDLVAEAITARKIPELMGYSSQSREVKYGKNSRVDILLEDTELGRCYVEVKNVTMRRHFGRHDPVEFPDGVTARGAKHLVELSDMVAEGHRAVMFYLVQRGDCSAGVTIARDIDPKYGYALDKARNAGVEVIAYGCKLNLNEIKITKSLVFLN